MTAAALGNAGRLRWQSPLQTRLVVVLAAAQGQGQVLLLVLLVLLLLVLRRLHHCEVVYRRLQLMLQVRCPRCPTDKH